MSFTFSGMNPSTPTRSKRSLFAQPQSTTPKVPPPSHLSHPSTTPLGPPPQSVFGSSANPASRNKSGNTGSAQRGFNVPDSSPPFSRKGVHQDQYGLDEDMDADAMGEDEYDDFDALMDAGLESPAKNAFMGSIADSPRGLKRSRNGKVRDQAGAGMASVARGFISQKQKSATQTTSDGVIIRQEDILAALDEQLQKSSEDFENTLAIGTAKLTGLWRESADVTTKEGGIGPATTNGLNEATCVGSLLLQLHHPHISHHSSSYNRDHAALIKRSVACTEPRALLDWLETYHLPFPDDFETIHRHRPSPADHERFWDSIYASIARGKFIQAIKLLRDAGWDHAVTAIDDFPQLQPEGYTGRQLENIELVVGWCVQALTTCPALSDDDWDVRGPDWRIFRQRVRQALKNFENFAGGEEGTDFDARPENVFQRSAGLNSNTNPFSLSAASKRAESKVPWSVYENLKIVYGLLLGGVDELLDTSQDWLEASLYLTIWWDGEDENAPKLNRSTGQFQKPREVDVSPLTAYRKRLADAFDLVSTDADLDAVFQVDTLDAIQVALACVLEDDVDSTVGLLRAWSLPITSAIVEVAALGGWLPQARPRSAGLLQQGFNSEDLMVLSHGPSQASEQSGEIDRDRILKDYAKVLGQKPSFQTNDGKAHKEGWELAVSVLGRLDDGASAHGIVGEMLARIELTDNDRVDRVLSACDSLGLVDQSRSISERYADSLASTNRSYGTALLYYARAHAISKLKSTLALLTTFCLVQSAAVPSHVALEPSLASLLGKDREGLLQLANTDNEAATILSSHISGYATVRRFYNLRDSRGVPLSLQAKRRAATALVAVIESAADCIRGGLFDPAVDSIVPVDGLLVLLGETLPLLGQESRTFTRDQVFALIRVVEDLSIAPSRIRHGTEELLHATMAARHDLASGSSGARGMRSSKRDLSRDKSTGALSGSSSYDMLASASLMLGTARDQDQQVARKSPEDETKRAWDWRKGLDGMPGGMEVGADTVLLLLRTALAQEVARGWSGIVRW